MFEIRRIRGWRKQNSRIHVKERIPKNKTKNDLILSIKIRRKLTVC